MKALLKWVSPAGESARLSTLIFHRVLAEPDALFPEEIVASRFDNICEWLASWFNVLPLDRAVRQMKAGQLPDRALAITFDDGYADNHDIALPILLRHRLPATFFIATGFIDGGRMWNDTVIESIRGCTADELDLRPLGIERVGVLSLGDAAQRRAAIDLLLRAIKYRAPAERIALTERIARAARVSPSERLMLDTTQLRGLQRAGMQIGAHTVSHPILATLPDTVARAEMVDSRRTLENLLDAPVRLFAYPNGRPGQDYTPASVALARAAGFEAAVSTAKGTADAGSDLYQLPRFTPWDRSRWRFGARMASNLWSPAARAATATTVTA